MMFRVLTETQTKIIKNNPFYLHSIHNNEDFFYNALHRSDNRPLGSKKTVNLATPKKRVGDEKGKFNYII